MNASVPPERVNPPVSSGTEDADRPVRCPADAGTPAAGEHAHAADATDGDE